MTGTTGGSAAVEFEDVRRSFGGTHALAGLNLALRSTPAAAMKAAGVRLDGRVVFGWRGVGFDDDVHTTYAIGASMFMRF